MTEINSFLAEKGIYMLTVILFFLGMFGMATCGNYMKKLMCMNIMQIAVIFFFLCLGQKSGGTIPVTISGLLSSDDYINPLPHDADSHRSQPGNHRSRSGPIDACERQIWQY